MSVAWKIFKDLTPLKYRIHAKIAEGFFLIKGARSKYVMPSKTDIAGCGKGH